MERRNRGRKLSGEGEAVQKACPWECPWLGIASGVLCLELREVMIGEIGSVNCSVGNEFTLSPSGDKHL